MGGGLICGEGGGVVVGSTVWPKIFKVENFCRFGGSEHGRKKISPAKAHVHNRCKAWLELGHKNFICENSFLSRIWKNHEIFIPQKF